MEKCENIISILFTGAGSENKQADVGMCVVATIPAIALLLSRRIGSPYLKQNILSGNFWKRPWAITATGLGISTGLLGLTFPKKSINSSSYGEHFKSFVGGTLSAGALALVQAGFDYFFPRIGAFTNVAALSFCGVAGAIEIYKEIKD